MTAAPAVTPDVADPGLFGPESVAWRIHSDPAMALAGFRALLLQAVHPVVMAGFSANSVYRDDPWGRLQRTGEWVDTTVFGTTRDATRAGARLRGVHRRLQPIVDPVTGVATRIDDPALLLWVHVTEVESFLSTYHRLGGRLDTGDADRYVDEMRRSAEQVGLDPATVPATEAEIAVYYEGIRPSLRVTSQARAAALWGFAPSMPRWVELATPARPAWASLVAVSAGLLPRWARRLYGLPGLPTSDLAATVTGRAVRQLALTLPTAVRRSPAQRAAFARVGPPTRLAA